MIKKLKCAVQTKQTAGICPTSLLPLPEYPYLQDFGSVNILKPPNSEEMRPN